MRILVLQLKRIGDLILTTPALAALRKKFPDAHITLVIEDRCRDLVPAITMVNDCVIWKSDKMRLAQKLIFNQFDACLDFTGNDRSAFFSLLSKAKNRIAYQSVTKSKLRGFCYNNLVSSSVRDNHTIDHYIHLLQALNIETENIPITLNLPQSAIKNAQQILTESNIDGPFVMVHPGTARPEKYWVARRWSAVIDHCVGELKFPCVLTGSNDDAELSHVNEIKSAAQNRCVDLCGRLDLLTLAALAAKPHLLLSADSAPMHLAAAFRTRQVALFGPTNPFHWRPRHDKAIVIVAGTDQPSNEFAPYHNGIPMSEISTAQVIHAICLSTSCS